MPEHNLAETGVQTAKKLATVSLLLVATSSPAAAVHDTLECDPPGSLLPLLELLHSFTELAFLGGVGLATLGFTFAGICLIIPGQEWDKRGKNVAKSVLIGTVILLSANMIVQFIITQMGGTICS